MRYAMQRCYDHRKFNLKSIREMIIVRRFFFSLRSCVCCYFFDSLTFVNDTGFQRIGNIAKKNYKCICNNQTEYFLYFFYSYLHNFVCQANVPGNIAKVLFNVQRPRFLYITCTSLVKAQSSPQNV